MSVEFVFTTIGLRKVTSTGKEVLRAMSLSFLPGAKIGVIGPNGSGKSTTVKLLCHILAEAGLRAAPRAQTFDQ